ncbi:MAG: PspA-associated protein PspAA [Ktedonobacterales bacterium]
MIVRIMAEDQYRLDDSYRAKLEQLDEAAETALNSGDEAAFAKALHDLTSAVREYGQVIPDSEIVPSDWIIPGPDMTLAEARARLQHVASVESKDAATE